MGGKRTPYLSLKKLSTNAGFDLAKSLKPLTDSYVYSKKTFTVQSFNLACGVFVFKVLLGDIIINPAVQYSHGFTKTALGLLLVFLLLIAPSLIKENKYWKWQTIYTINYKDSLKLLKYLAPSTICLYLIKEYIIAPWLIGQKIASTPNAAGNVPK